MIMDNLDFSEEEIQEQLSALGYKNIPRHRLCEFKQDLDDLVRRGEWKSFASSAGMNSATSQPSPPAYTKEKVGPCYFENSGHGFFLHAGKVEHDRQVISCDSYARHSVVLNLGPPYGPTRGLPVEEEAPPPPDPDESLHPALTDSYASTPDSHRGRYIKRKVLRKHEGRSLVCDESVYSEEDKPHKRLCNPVGHHRGELHILLQEEDLDPGCRRNPLSSLSLLPPQIHTSAATCTKRTTRTDLQSTTTTRTLSAPPFGPMETDERRRRKRRLRRWLARKSANLSACWRTSPNLLGMQRTRSRSLRRKRTLNPSATQKILSRRRRRRRRSPHLLAEQETLSRRIQSRKTTPTHSAVQRTPTARIQRRRLSDLSARRSPHLDLRVKKTLLRRRRTLVLVRKSLQ
nr:uncharacterized protein si:dkey-23f9.4 isoform X3 [Gasterosteus aculeatus aculeatus]XP_040041451.1 uncharacterized protein si:dkey-23f9.4 isoform X3 [Gasterosteus aculeatus aculeatus]